MIVETSSHEVFDDTMERGALVSKFTGLSVCILASSKHTEVLGSLGHGLYRVQSVEYDVNILEELNVS